MKFFLLIILSAIFGCGRVYNDNQKKIGIFVDSSCLKNCNFPIFKTYVLDSMLSVELKLTNRFSDNYDLFIHEKFNDTIHIFDVADNVRSFVKTHIDFEELLKLNDNILLDSLENIISNKLFTEQPKRDSLPIDISIESLNRYLSKSSYFKGLTVNDIKKLKF